MEPLDKIAEKLVRREEGAPSIRNKTVRAKEGALLSFGKWVKEIANPWESEFRYKLPHAPGVVSIWEPHGSGADTARNLALLFEKERDRTGGTYRVIKQSGIQGIGELLGQRILKKELSRFKVWPSQKNIRIEMMLLLGAICFFVLRYNPGQDDKLDPLNWVALSIGAALIAVIVSKIIVQPSVNISELIEDGAEKLLRQPAKHQDQFVKRVATRIRNGDAFVMVIDSFRRIDPLTRKVIITYLETEHTETLLQMQEMLKVFIFVDSTYPDERRSFEQIIGDGFVPDYLIVESQSAIPLELLPKTPISLRKKLPKANTFQSIALIGLLANLSNESIPKNQIRKLIDFKKRWSEPELQKFLITLPEMKKIERDLRALKDAVTEDSVTTLEKIFKVHNTEIWFGYSDGDLIHGKMPWTKGDLLNSTALHLIVCFGELARLAKTDDSLWYFRSPGTSRLLHKISAFMINDRYKWLSKVMKENPDLGPLFSQYLEELASGFSLNCRFNQGRATKVLQEDLHYGSSTPVEFSPEVFCGDCAWNVDTGMPEFSVSGPAEVQVLNGLDGALSANLRTLEARRFCNPEILDTGELLSYASGDVKAHLHLMLAVHSVLRRSAFYLQEQSRSDVSALLGNLIHDPVFAGITALAESDNEINEAFSRLVEDTINDESPGDQQAETDLIELVDELRMMYAEGPQAGTVLGELTKSLLKVAAWSIAEAVGDVKDDWYAAELTDFDGDIPEFCGRCFAHMQVIKGSPLHVLLACDLARFLTVRLSHRSSVGSEGERVDKYYEDLMSHSLSTLLSEGANQAVAGFLSLASGTFLVYGEDNDKAEHFLLQAYKECSSIELKFKLGWILLKSTVGGGDLFKDRSDFLVWVPDSYHQSLCDLMGSENYLGTAEARKTKLPMLISNLDRYPEGQSKLLDILISDSEDRFSDIVMKWHSVSNIDSNINETTVKQTLSELGEDWYWIFHYLCEVCDKLDSGDRGSWFLRICMDELRRGKGYGQTNSPNLLIGRLLPHEQSFSEDERLLCLDYLCLWESSVAKDHPSRGVQLYTLICAIEHSEPGTEYYEKLQMYQIRDAEYFLNENLEVLLRENRWLSLLDHFIQVLDRADLVVGGENGSFGVTAEGFLAVSQELMENQAQRSSSAKENVTGLAYSIRENPAFRNRMSMANILGIAEKWASAISEGS